MYLVDLPNPHDVEDAWHQVAEFDTKEEAIAFVKEKFGGDDRGRISLITQVDEDGEEIEE